MLVLAGTPEQLRQYDAGVGTADKVSAPVLILGGGRVGQAIARALARRNIAHCIVVAVQTAGQMQINPEPSMALPAHADVILIGTAEAEQQLLHAWS